MITSYRSKPGCSISTRNSGCQGTSWT